MQALSFAKMSIKLTIPALLGRVDRLGKLSGDAALQENEQIYVLLHSLYLECQTKASKIETSLKETRDQLKSNNELKVKIEASVRDGEKRVHQLEQDVVSLNARIDALSKVIAAEQGLLAVLKLKKAEIERRKIDLAKWFWVPGYNLYLVGRTIDDAVAQIPNLERRIHNLVNGDIKPMEQQKAKRAQELKDIRTEIWKKSLSLATAKSFSKELQARERRASKDLVVLETSKRKLNEFSTLTHSAEERNRVIQKFITFLDEDVPLKEEDQTLYVAYRQVFVDLGAVLDKYQ